MGGLGGLGVWGMGVYTCVLPLSVFLAVESYSPQALNGIPGFALQVSNQFPDPYPTPRL